MTSSRQEILDTLTRLLREVVGEDWTGDIEIHEGTSFSNDLELESIEFVALAEKLHGVYGERVDFVQWLSGLELDQIIQLEVGDMVDFIDRCLTAERD